MLKLKNLSKDYYVANYKVEALKDINVSFRKNEFVAILGPSGSGKTTLLNIVGGLDKYSSGNLVINNRETKTFNDRDWDVYRNHRVGFVFQSYNLIPHQSVLSNVELALTIAGLKKEERVKRAKEALDKVGLSDQYYKKPNQLSGGQSQRVAIARALVNDPEILLADEPTGALDTKTSEQIMDLIKEIASDRLVIMVTHNPKLASKYANRIINLLDGKILDDSNPYKSKKEITPEVVKTSERAKMSWWTTFKLSIQNLLSKRSRTILTSIASSIGIIGISLVLSMSHGVKTFIKHTQEDMLSGNPIQISSQAFDLEAMMSNMGFEEKRETIKEINRIGVDEVIKRLAERSKDAQSLFIKNNINQEYLDYIDLMSNEDVAAIFYNREIDISNNLYFDFKEEDGTITNLSMSALRSVIVSILNESEDTKGYASLVTNFTNIFNETPIDISNPNSSVNNYILNQYELMGNSRMPASKDEILIVLNNDGLISDLTLAQLGFYGQAEFQNMIFAALEDPKYDDSITHPTYFEYDDVLNKELFTFHSNDTVFTKNTNAFEPGKIFDYHAYGSDITPDVNSLGLTVVGILKLKDNIEYGSLDPGFYYTKALADYIIDTNINSEIVDYINNQEDGEEGEYIFRSFNFKDDEQNIDLDLGITFKYSYTYMGDLRANLTGFVGTTDPISGVLSSFGDFNMSQQFILSKRDLGGEVLPSLIEIYATDLEHKDNVINYLSGWSETDEGRLNPITYMDPLSIVFTMINQMINIVTIALIGFTSLALFVSSVMIAIITYVSVVERVKEIGVIRSLGGRKKDVSNLFVAETAIIGLISGLIAVMFTYFASFIINLVVSKSLGDNIALFPIGTAALMIGISVFLTLVSGFIPSRSAAKKDPVVALRSE